MEDLWLAQLGSMPILWTNHCGYRYGCYDWLSWGHVSTLIWQSGKSYMEWLEYIAAEYTRMPSAHPFWGLSPKPGHENWLGIKLVTFPCIRWHPTEPHQSELPIFIFMALFISSGNLPFFPMWICKLFTIWGTDKNLFIHQAYLPQA